jgi:hypothetical protein
MWLFSMKYVLWRTTGSAPTSATVADATGSWVIGSLMTVVGFVASSMMNSDMVDEGDAVPRESTSSWVGRDMEGCENGGRRCDGFLTLTTQIRVP